jgi:hypothetical protein
MITDRNAVKEIQHRDDLPEFMNRHGLTGEATELGTYFGEYAEKVLRTWKGRRLNLVDPYSLIASGEYLDGCTIDHDTMIPLDFEKVFWKAHALLIPFETAYFIRQTSFGAAKIIADDSQDMVYVDANHSFKHVSQDIETWWPKLKRGGVMGLHDCYTRDDEFLKCGVFDAVMDHAERIGQRPRLTYCTTAWFVKL